MIAFARGEQPSVRWYILAAACVYALGYRFYSAFIGAKVPTRTKTIWGGR